MFGSYFDTHFEVNPDPRGPNPCVCHLQKPQCLTWDSPCPNRFDDRDDEPRDTIQFDDEDDYCPRCQDPVPGDQHAHHQINDRWVPCNAPHCIWCAGYQAPFTPKPKPQPTYTSDLDALDDIPF